MQRLKQALAALTLPQAVKVFALIGSLMLGASTLIALCIVMPPQYRFVVIDAVARGWPFAAAVAFSAFYVILLFWILRAARLLTTFYATLAAAPIATLLATGLLASGAVPTVLAAGVAAIVVVLATFFFIREDNRWTRLPTAMNSPWLPAALGVLAYLIVAFASSRDPIVMPRQFGSLAILTIFIGVIGVLAVVAVIRPRVGALLVAYVAVASIFFGSNDHSIPQVEPKARDVEMQSTFAEWLSKRRDLETYRAAGLPYPVVLVSSEGGGIYAAAHAYGTLTAIAAHCPTFSQHVFAVVGVSGGALGNALFAETLDPVQKPHQPCTGVGKRIDPRPVTVDHLSPVIARFLLVEPLDRLVPGQWMDRDRAQILTDSFLSVAKDKAYLSRAISDSFTKDDARPAVISVAVDVANGRRFVMSPFNPGEYAGTSQWWPGSNPFSDDETAGPEIGVINAAGISARFPWITPTGRLQVNKNKHAILADGGYFDNSGGDTVADLINVLQMGENLDNYFDEAAEADTGPAYFDEGPCAIRVRRIRNYNSGTAWAPCEVPIFVIHLAIASSSRLEPAPQSQSFLFDPLKTLLATRTSRAEIALQRADLDLCGMGGVAGAECLAVPGSTMGFFRNDIFPREMGLPLGWFMPKKSFDTIVQRTVPASAFDYRKTRKEADTDLEMFAHHFDPALYAENAELHIGDLMPDP